MVPGCRAMEFVLQGGLSCYSTVQNKFGGLNPLGMGIGNFFC
jgi:hypothetical protein